MEQGHCPKCNTLIEEYHDTIWYDDDLAYPFVCKKCGLEADESYHLVFSGFYDPEGEPYNSEI